MDSRVTSELGQACLQGLLREWFDFERQLGRVPVIQRLERGRFTREDYLTLLLNLRQQEGARWITRGASSFDRNFADVRSEVIGHAQEEHQDYETLEADFAAAELESIRTAPRNAGSEARILPEHNYTHGMEGEFMGAKGMHQFSLWIKLAKAGGLVLGSCAAKRKSRLLPRNSSDGLLKAVGHPIDSSHYL